MVTCLGISHSTTTVHDTIGFARPAPDNDEPSDDDTPTLSHNSKKTRLDDNLQGLASIIGERIHISIWTTQHILSGTLGSCNRMFIVCSSLPLFDK
jgi:hypothetical protein